MSYVPAVYRTSGGSELVVASSGRVLVESGGTLQMASGATLTLTGQAHTSTGTVTGNAITSTGNVTGLNFIQTAIAAASSGSTGFVSYGVTQIWSCAVSTGHVFTMPAASAAGVAKYITCNISTSTAPAVVTIAGTLIGASNTLSFSTGATNPQWIHLIAENTTNWFVIGKSTDVTIS